MTKLYKMDAVRLRKWIEQLRRQDVEKLTDVYFPHQTTFDYDYLCSLREKPCACANGHFILANLDDLLEEDESDSKVFTADNIRESVGDALHCAVVHLNDGSGNEDDLTYIEPKSLDEIADWLEANVEPV